MSLYLRNSIPEADSSTISGFWTQMEWMRTTMNVCTPEASEKGKSGECVQRDAADLAY
jgi:hypothetical protein